jgi:hypothetical protein
MSGRVEDEVREYSIGGRCRQFERAGRLTVHCPRSRQRAFIALWPAIEEIQMISLDDLKRTIRRNKLLGMWAAEKLGLTGADAEAYSNDLAVGTVDPERSDVFSKVRKDFDAAGVVLSDEQILDVMNKLFLQAADQTEGTRGADSDAAAVMIARNLTTR